MCLPIDEAGQIAAPRSVETWPADTTTKRDFSRAQPRQKSWVELDPGKTGRVRRLVFFKRLEGLKRVIGEPSLA